MSLPLDSQSAVDTQQLQIKRQRRRASDFTLGGGDPSNSLSKKLTGNTSQSRGPEDNARAYAGATPPPAQKQKLTRNNASSITQAPTFCKRPKKKRPSLFGKHIRYMRSTHLHNPSKQVWDKNELARKQRDNSTPSQLALIDSMDMRHVLKQLTTTSVSIPLS